MAFPRVVDEDVTKPRSCGPFSSPNPDGLRPTAVLVESIVSRANWKVSFTSFQFLSGPPAGLRFFVPEVNSCIALALPSVRASPRVFWFDESFQPGLILEFSSLVFHRCTLISAFL